MAEGKNQGSLAEPSSWFLNRGLFSDHFLKARLPQWKEWQSDGELATFRKQLLSLYEPTKPILPFLNEPQTEKEFVQPVLDLLGYANGYIVQAPTQVGEHTNRPDYALFPDQTAKNKAYEKLKNNDYTLCIGVADAKYWERELDLAKSSDRDTFTNQNPSFQIANYLTGTKQTWGILTNGRLWRLYCAKSHLPLGNYYQVDLVQLLEKAPEESLKYFYLFFRKAALIQVDGKSFLDRVLEDSNQYAVELEADIKERAYDVVEILCRGFAAGFSHDQLTEQALKTIYDNSLTLLYRLLFVFYAEARELLPMTTNQSYREKYSIHKLTQEIDETLAKGYQLSSKSTIYYQRISNLSKLINEGDTGQGVPEYNGGLFDPEEHPFLEEYAITDAFLVEAIRQLARIPDRKLGREVAVDYNTLSERHLGSIYEGLLEFKPRIAPSDLVTTKDKGSIKYAPADKYPDKKTAYKKGELYLANDKGERKASGSYYTPEYIVKYIVENTLDPLVKEAQEKVKALKPEVDKTIANWEKLKEQKQGLEPTDKYDRKIAEERERLLEPYLSLKVLDPAMGSGHFLARATDFLAEAIATDPSIESPTGLTEESELTYYRRRVVESCIYGVDLNPLAVELTKLTLWLETMAKSKPLSFLNHNLRVGNSLIGAKVADLDEIPKVKRKKGKPIDLSRAPVQLGLFQEAFNKKLYDLLQNRALIAQLPTETLEDVHNKQKWERDFEHNMQRFRTLADLWVSTYFGSSVRWDEYNTLVENLQSPDPKWAKLMQKESVQRAMAMSEERRSFHWELEFPEVFYDEKGNRKPTPGFDAVIGNPPYVDSEEMARSHAELRQYCSTQWKAASGNWDLFVVFVELGLTLSRSGGYSSLIVPNKLLGAEYSAGIQSLLKSNQPVSFRDFSSVKVFDTDVYPIVYVVQVRKGTPNDILSLSKMATSGLGSPTLAFEKRIKLKVLTSLPEGYWWPIFSDNIGIISKAVEVSKPLADYANVIGAATVSESYKIAELLTPLGKASSGDEYLVFVNTGTIDRYESLWAVDPTQYIKGTYRKPVVSRKALSQEMPTRYEQARAPKLILAGMVKSLEGLYDADGMILAGKSTVVVMNTSLSLLYLLSLVNSKLMTLLCKEIFGSLALSGGFLALGPPQVQKLPVPVVNFTTPENERRQLLEKGKKLYQEYLISNDWSKALAFVGECLLQKVDGTLDVEQEKSDIVHDLLAFLAEEMTLLNKENQSRIKAFLSWLEKEILKGSVEDQKNKTRIKGFHNNTFEDLLEVLKKNKVVPDPCPSNIRDSIASEFSAAVNALTPLKARIKATDNLIDQIVYKLYGLTDAEIAIVEGQYTKHKPV